ncbi:MAG TPA: pantoate--beta-alanine ligase, partial [Ktedonobacteraceae bacterium]
MRVVTTVREMIDARAQLTGSRKVGLVPTMGYLHEGHLSLVRHGRAENDVLIASIFVNPTQFSANEDLERYPRDLQRDLQMLEAAALDIVFAPTTDEIYPPGFATYVEPIGPLANEGEGKHRPGHFRGVATVVLKLFQIVQPHLAYFGQKDAQQAAVISRMAMDLNLPVALRILATIREADGLAISSRNAYLTVEERMAARVLYQALLAGRQICESLPGGGTAAVVRAMVETVARESGVYLDYAEVRDPQSFALLETLRAPAL